MLNSKIFIISMVSILTATASSYAQAQVFNKTREGALADFTGSYMCTVTVQNSSGIIESKTSQFGFLGFSENSLFLPVRPSNNKVLEAQKAWNWNVDSTETVYPANVSTKGSTQTTIRVKKTQDTIFIQDTVELKDGAFNATMETKIVVKVNDSDVLIQSIVSPKGLIANTIFKLVSSVLGDGSTKITENYHCVRLRK